MSHIPRIYRPPLGGPLRWQDDVSGKLPRAVHAYLRHERDAQPMRREDLELVRDYLEYYIHAPCWRTETMEAQFARLRESVKALSSVGDIDAWIYKCLEIGIDPL